MEAVRSDLAALVYAERFERLIAAYVAHDADHGRDRTVREFVAEFRGLSGSAKQKAVLEGIGPGARAAVRLVRDNAVDAVLVGGAARGDAGSTPRR